MTIDEAIKHAREVAEENRKQEALENQCDLFWNAQKCRRCAEEHEQIAEWLEELKARREAMEWIVTKDKRPTENQIVLTCDLKGWISTDIYNSGSMHRWNSGFYVAWMPLPKPYKE